MVRFSGSLFQNDRNKKWAPTAHFLISPMFLTPPTPSSARDRHQQSALRILAPNKKASRGGFLASRKIW
jgi:hypothetical protein